MYYANSERLEVANADPTTRETVNIYNMLVAQALATLRENDKQRFERVREIAQQAVENQISEVDAAKAIAEYLPAQSAAAVKQLGRQGSLAKFLRSAALAGKLATAAAPFVAGGAWIYERLYPNTPAVTLATPPPAPPITIQNNVTVVNPPVAQERTSQAKPPVSREQTRRIRQIERQGEKTRQQQPVTHPYPKPEGPG